MHQHTIRRIVPINDTTWKATSPHTLIASWLGSLSTSCSHHFFPSWLSKWAPYMDSLAETSCKCHVGLRRKHKTYIQTPTQSHRVELHADMLFEFSPIIGKLFQSFEFLFCSCTFQECQPNTDWPRWSAPTWSLMFICVQWCFFFRHWPPVGDVASVASQLCYTRHVDKLNHVVLDQSTDFPWQITSFFGEQQLGNI